MYKTNRRDQLFSVFFQRARAQAAREQPQTATARLRGSIWRAFGAGVASLGALRAAPGVWSEPGPSQDGRDRLDRLDMLDSIMLYSPGGYRTRLAGKQRRGPGWRFGWRCAFLALLLPAKACRQRHVMLSS